MIRAVVFDFDGLILDTEKNEFRSFQQIYRQFGFELTLERWSGCVGTDQSVFNPYDDLERCIGKPLDREAIRTSHRRQFDEWMENERPLPGVETYLREAKNLGLKIGLASSSSRAWVTGYLQRHGLIDYFDCIRTRDDVEKVKPDPALYRLAVQCLGVEPTEAVAFEDSPNGALAAKRAGLYCVVVPNEVTAPLTFGEYDIRLRSLKDMPLSELIERLEKSA
jgi:HAD superfamily hydrolase (TIGR01509 family)